MWWYLLDTTMIPSGLFWETISTIPMHKIKLQFVHFVNQVTHQVPNCIKLDIWLLPSLMDGWLQMNHILYPSSSSNEVNCSLSILSRHQNNIEFLECILTYYIAVLHDWFWRSWYFVTKALSSLVSYLSILPSLELRTIQILFYARTLLKFPITKWKPTTSYHIKYNYTFPSSNSK